ncbi:MAG: SDR family NAD(P)-dependent oxidoreductase [Mycobacteriaceae bacterium]
MSQRILITGGASGLGSALAQRFCARGDQVIITDLAEYHEVPSGASYLKLDVTNTDDWENARKETLVRFGGLDILINNAGIATAGRIDHTSLIEWRRAMDINVFGVVNGCQAFSSMLISAGSGHIVNTASLAGLVHPAAMSSYSASKAAVVALSESIYYELSSQGVAVSVICPSFFRTNLAQSLSQEDPQMSFIASKLIGKARIDADQIAVMAIKGIDAKKFLILTDQPAKKAYRTKRFARPLYDKTMRKMSIRMKETIASFP